jgi:hypothetical protein
MSPPFLGRRWLYWLLSNLSGSLPFLAWCPGLENHDFMYSDWFLVVAGRG